MMDILQTSDVNSWARVAIYNVRDADLPMRIMLAREQVAFNLQIAAVSGCSRIPREGSCGVRWCAQCAVSSRGAHREHLLSVSDGGSRGRTGEARTVRCETAESAQTSRFS